MSRIVNVRQRTQGPSVVIPIVAEGGVLWKPAWAEYLDAARAMQPHCRTAAGLKSRARSLARKAARQRSTR